MVITATKNTNKQYQNGDWFNMEMNVNGYNIVVREDSTTNFVPVLVMDGPPPFEVLPRDIPGVKYKPQMAQYSNVDDWNFTWTASHPVEVTKKSYDLVAVLAQRYATHGIMEIGVCNNGVGSFTNALLTSKPDSVPYLGIDYKDKSFLDDPAKNVHTVIAHSADQIKIRDAAKKIGMDKVSILLIDGWHSVDMVINDWLYSDMLSENGIVIFHDTNSHPGPVVFLPAIDEKMYKVTKFFEKDDDYGLSVAYRTA